MLKIHWEVWKSRFAFTTLNYDRKACVFSGFLSSISIIHPQAHLQKLLKCLKWTATYVPWEPIPLHKQYSHFQTRWKWLHLGRQAGQGRGNKIGFVHVYLVVCWNLVIQHIRSSFNMQPFPSSPKRHLRNHSYKFTFSWTYYGDFRWTMAVFFMEICTQSMNSWIPERTNDTEELHRPHIVKNNLINICKAVDGEKADFEDSR